MTGDSGKAEPLSSEALPVTFSLGVRAQEGLEGEQGRACRITTPRVLARIGGIDGPPGGVQAH